MNNEALAVHACGFENKFSVCSEFRLRLLTAINIVEKNGCQNVIISGGVPYEPGSPMLAYIGGMFFGSNYNLCQSVNVFYALNCFNSSTDVQAFISLALEKEFTKITAISSYWHLWALKPIYRYWNKKARNRLEIRFVSLDTGMAGNKTICFYFVYGFLVRAFMALGLFKMFDEALNSIHSKRTLGYPVSGCD